MKVIDLLNKIAIDDNYKPTFKFRNSTYKYNTETKYYEPSFMGLYKIYMILNDEVEIIEDEFIDIEEFKEHQIFNTRDILELQMFINKKNADYDCKINDLIKNQKKIIDKLKDSE